MVADVSVNTPADKLVLFRWRLTNRACWLNIAHSRLLAMPDIGRRTSAEAQFLQAIDLWDSIDSILHGSVAGCALGAGGPCLKTSVASCRRCSG